MGGLMRTAYRLSLLLLLSPFAAAHAQRADSSSARADSLRHQIEERFASRAQERLGLTNDQTTKLRATSRQFGARRGELRARAHRLRESLRAQLQPGVAANQDSVAKLTDAMIELRLAEAQLSRDEIKEQSKYLNSVQRAQLYVMRERFADRVKEVHGRRGEMGGKHRRGHWDDTREHREGPGERGRGRQRAEPSGQI
jgi:Spy/CpxP family protein refolding chaperone